jgi:hypothetical protein
LESLEARRVLAAVADVAVAGLLGSLILELFIASPVGFQEVTLFAVGCFEYWLARVGHCTVSREVHGLPVVVVAGLRHECGFFGRFDSH